MARSTANILHNNYTGGRSIYNVVAFAAIKINTQFESFRTQTALLGIDKVNLALDAFFTQQIGLRTGGCKNLYSSYKPPLCGDQIKIYCLPNGRRARTVCWRLQIRKVLILVGVLFINHVEVI